MIINTAINLIKRVTSISDVEFHYDELCELEQILKSNNFPSTLIENLFAKYMKNVQKHLLTQNYLIQYIIK